MVSSGFINYKLLGNASSCDWLYWLVDCDSQYGFWHIVTNPIRSVIYICICIYIYMCVCVCSQLLRSKALKPIPGWTSWTPIYSTSILNGSWLSRFPHHPSGLQQTEGAFDGLGQSATDVKKSGKIPLFIIMGPNKKLQVCRSQLTPLMNRERPVNSAQEAGWSRGSKTKHCVTLRLQPNDKQRETRFYHMICSFWRPIFRFTLSVRRLVIWYVKTRWWHCGSCQL